MITVAVMRENSTKFGKTHSRLFANFAFRIFFFSKARPAHPAAEAVLIFCYEFPSVCYRFF